jgi:hypothetical protein
MKKPAAPWAAGFFAGAAHLRTRHCPGCGAMGFPDFLQKYGVFARRPQKPLLQCEALRL